MTSSACLGLSWSQPLITSRCSWPQQKPSPRPNTIPGFLSATDSHHQFSVGTPRVTRVPALQDDGDLLSAVRPGVEPNRPGPGPGSRTRRVEGDRKRQAQRCSQRLAESDRNSFSKSISQTQRLIPRPSTYGIVAYIGVLNGVGPRTRFQHV